MIRELARALPAILRDIPRSLAWAARSRTGRLYLAAIAVQAAAIVYGLAAR